MNNNQRINQLRRTRKDILSAASRLLKQDKLPSMEEVAKEALVSRATVYRYFNNIESLLAEAPIDGSVPNAEDLFAEGKSNNPLKRIDKAEKAFHDIVYKNEAQLRIMLAHSMYQKLGEKKNSPFPVRQNRRCGVIKAALAPVREKFEDSIYKKTCAALAALFATESMIVYKDVLNLDKKTAREVNSWAVQTLVRAALEESKKLIGKK